MKTTLLSVLLLVSGWIFTSLTAQNIESEISGIDGSAPPVAAPGSGRSLTDIPAGGLLLIPDSDTDRIMAFDPITGNLVDANFIPSDPTNLSTPKEVILSSTGQSLLVSDQIDDVVQEYDLDGNYVGIFAPAGGVDNTILDNIRGIALRPNGNLLVTVGSGPNAGNIAEFDTDGNYLGVFFDGSTGNVNSPFDVILRSGTDYLASEIGNDKIVRMDLSGAYIADFAPADNFPEQICRIGSGNILVANFGGTQTGVMEFTPAGTLVDIHTVPGISGYRGVYELPNGNILVSASDEVIEIDRSGNLIDTKISDIGPQFITYIPSESQPSVPLSPFSILIFIGLIAVFTLWKLKRA